MWSDNMTFMVFKHNTGCAKVSSVFKLIISSKKKFQKQKINGKGLLSPIGVIGNYISISLLIVFRNKL